jgi:hypothetical protein
MAMQGLQRARKACGKEKAGAARFVLLHRPHWQSAGPDVTVTDGTIVGL